MNKQNNQQSNKSVQPKKNIFLVFLLSLIIGGVAYYLPMLLIGLIIKEVSNPIFFPILTFHIFYGLFIYTLLPLSFFIKKLDLKSTVLLTLLSNIILLIIFILFGPDGVFIDAAVCGHYDTTINDWISDITLSCIVKEALIRFEIMFLMFPYNILTIVAMMLPVIINRIYQKTKKIKNR